MISTSCVASERAPTGPAEVVEALHEAWLRQDLETVHRNVSYEYRLREQLGHVWDEGTPEQRARMVKLVRDMFVETLQERWNRHVAGEVLVTTERWHGDDLAWVTVATERRAERARHWPVFAWRYRVHRLDGVWRVTQREYAVGSAASDTSRFFPMVIGKIAAKYGREPDLGELNANLPSLIGTMRKRVFKVPKGIGRREPH